MKNKYLTLHTEQWYDSAHHLKNYNGACANLHGHTYKLKVWIKGEIDYIDPNTGILFDFGEIKKLAKIFDHNGDTTELMGINSTAENQSIFFYNKLKEMRPELEFKVRVYEQLQPKESYAEVGDF